MDDSDPCSIRLAELRDVGAMLSLANEAAATGVANFATEPESIAEWEDAFTRSNERFPWLVAERDGGGVAGFAKASPYRTRGAYLWTAELTVYVEPSRHRRGVGFALYRELIDTLVAQGFVTLVACITRGQEASERRVDTNVHTHGSFSWRTNWRPAERVEAAQCEGISERLGRSNGGKV